MGVFSSFLNTLSDTRRQSQNNEALKHSKSYSDLLDIYVKSVMDNTALKKWLKYYFSLLPWVR